MNTLNEPLLVSRSLTQTNRLTRSQTHATQVDRAASQTATPREGRAVVSEPRCGPVDNAHFYAFLSIPRVVWFNTK